jgi:hypothetical protein
MRWSVVLVLLGAPSVVWAQESPLHAESRREGERVSDPCHSFSFTAVPGCAYTLFTDHPLHIAAGSMPPQNGFGLGAAFVWNKNTRNWRMSWDVDATAAPGGAWRSGGYMKMVHTPHPAKGPVHVTVPTAGEPPKADEKAKAPERFTHPYTVFNLYAQSISLNKLNFFGLGNNTLLTRKSVFGMSQTIVGVSAIKPVFEWAAIRKLNLALLGEVNGRFVNVRGEHGQSAPSIEALYTNVTAPGLTSHPGSVQLGEGLRIKPMIGDSLHLNYLGKFEQFFVPATSRNSFLRWTVDLDHTYYLHAYTNSAPKSTEGVGPDSCAPGGEPCPKISYSRNLNGSIGARLLISESITSGASVVPFYFQQTLGGLDINSALSLGSYQDYRFRAPNVLLLQGYIEHSIWGPFGLKFMADQGRVALTRGDLGFSHMKHSFAGGLTLRAGGFPMVSLMFAWGGSEGHHNIVNMNTSLLGGSARPSLF